MIRMHRVASVAATLLLVVAADRLAAQDTLPRLTVAVHGSRLAPRGGGQAFALFDRALTPGVDAWHVRLVGGEARWRAVRRWSVVAGVESGTRTVETTARGSAIPDPLQQRTTLTLRALGYAGVSWTPWNMRIGHQPVTLAIGAGAGHASYRLHQRGTFLDADRQLAYDGDYVSAGRGTFGYADARVSTPLRHGVAVEAALRRQVGSAGMSGDFAGFDRLDLTGTQVSVGVAVTPGRRHRR